jgi:HPt (histidine-containing phosphotransfer) domain-containing protein
VGSARPVRNDGQQPIIDTPAPVFRQQDLLGRLRGDRSLAADVIAGFLADFPGQLAILAACLETHDDVAARRQAHKIKGAAASIAAIRIRDVAAQIQQAADAGEIAHAIRLNALLEQEFNALANAVESAGFSIYATDIQNEKL